jgi:hypothetical protein
MAFWGKEPVRSKICIENAISEQANNFHYLGYNLTHKEEIDIENQLEKFKTAWRIINQVFHPAKFEKTRICTCKTLVIPVLLTYGSKAWTIRQQDEQRLTTAEMKFTRITLYGTTWETNTF